MRVDQVVMLGVVLGACAFVFKLTIRKRSNFSRVVDDHAIKSLETEVSDMKKKYEENSQIEAKLQAELKTLQLNIKKDFSTGWYFLK